MFSQPKLSFEVSNNVGDITLEQAFCGAFGNICIGENGVALWVPGDEHPKEKEMIFDMRNRPLSEQDAQLFQAACKGHFMNVSIAMMSSTDPERIKAILSHFDYVLIPDRSIKNTPEDFKKRVLSYKPAQN